MAEIIILWRLAVWIGRSAAQKKLPKRRYQIMAILLWICGEVLGGFFGATLFENPNSFWSVYIPALLGAFIGAGMAFLIMHLLPRQKLNSIKPQIDQKIRPKKNFWRSIWVPIFAIAFAFSCVFLSIGGAVIQQMRTLQDMRASNPVVGTKLVNGSIVSEPEGKISSTAEVIYFGFDCGNGITEEMPITIFWYIDNKFALSTRGQSKQGHFIAEWDRKGFDKGKYLVIARYGEVDLTSITFIVE